MRYLLLSLLTLPALLACTPAPPQQEPLRAVRTMELQSDVATLQHEYAAEVRARTESRLAFRVGGKLVRRLVDVGSIVKAGQPLAQLDPADLALGQDAARAALAAAEAQLALNEAELKRYRELRDQGFISGLEFERREAALKTSRAQAEQMRAQAGMQVNQAGYAMLLADAPGVVTAVEAEPGAVLAAGAPVLRLAHDGPRDAVFSVPEDRLPALRALLGRPGALKMKPWGSDTLRPATVRELAAAADPVTRTFQVKADIGATDLRLGQTATVLVDAPPQAGIFKLPLTAVFEQGGQPQVWLVDPARMTVGAQPVAVAGAEGNLVLVAGGLAAGQRVVTAGVHTLTAGQTVRLYAEPAAALPPGPTTAVSTPPATVASAAASR